MIWWFDSILWSSLEFKIAPNFYQFMIQISEFHWWSLLIMISLMKFSKPPFHNFPLFWFYLFRGYRNFEMEFNFFLCNSPKDPWVIANGVDKAKVIKKKDTVIFFFQSPNLKPNSKVQTKLKTDQLKRLKTEFGNKRWVYWVALVTLN